MKRPVILLTVVGALVAATVLAWSDVRQARAFRRLIAEGDAAVGRGDAATSASTNRRVCGMRIAPLNGGGC